MDQDKYPLSDLSFFRFPDLTLDTVGSIVLLGILLVSVVVLTVLTQLWLMRRLRRRQQERNFDRLAGKGQMDMQMRSLLEHLVAHAPKRMKGFDLVHNVPAFERAVAAFVPKADDATLRDLSHLRRMFRINVMNVDLPLLSTRQLVQDQPVRFTAFTGGDRIDLYCTLLRVDERFLYFIPPDPGDLERWVEEEPLMTLLFWRRRDGEVRFRVLVEPIWEGEMVIFRCSHAFRERSPRNPDAFRLTLEAPMRYQFFSPGRLKRAPGSAAAQEASLSGEGRLLDMGPGGALVEISESLEQGGFLHLEFKLHETVQVAMMEVLSTTPAGAGHYHLRGQFRGMGSDALARLVNALIREQTSRLKSHNYQTKVV